MKLNRNPLETPVMDHHLSMRYSSRLFLLIILFILSLSYLFYYSINLPKSAFICNVRIGTPKKLSVAATTPVITSTPTKTNLHHLVFGIAASSNLWNRRKNYIKLWWRPHEMRGFVWLDTSLRSNANDDHLLPMVKISSSTSHFRYNYPKGHRSAIRISRIVSETLRLGLTDVRWFVMGDDDTFFVPDNLVRVLSKYDHNQFFYIGSNSESHTQNVRFSYGMAYGGGGFAISYPLAVALEKMQDRCIQRYPELYGSDDRIQACMTEVGVPLTKESGFHQYDVYGNLFGLLASHPITPLVSIHHLDVVNPIFPETSRVEALKRLTIPIKLDSAAIMQQSICYDNHQNWTVSVTWGYAVQILRGVLSPREVEKIARTFISWYRTGDAFAYAFNTRSYSQNICQKPHVYHFSNATYHDKIDQTISDYVWNQVPNPFCNWNIANPSEIVRVEVYKTPDPHLWDKSPRRNCCRVLPAERLDTMKVDVGVCRENEVIEQMLV